ncbi:hypothetical protein GA0115260_110633 [Streptomyces sp. MnatMP-M27]|nr:hypothetical protein GA0115260_110633 [Streptomyces sp. MnatMP-M27]
MRSGEETGSGRAGLGLLDERQLSTGGGCAVQPPYGQVDDNRAPAYRLIGDVREVR